MLKFFLAFFLCSFTCSALTCKNKEKAKNEYVQVLLMSSNKIILMKLWEVGIKGLEGQTILVLGLNVSFKTQTNQ